MSILRRIENDGSVEPRGWTEGDKALNAFLSFVRLNPSSWSIITLIVALAGAAGGAWLEHNNSAQIDSVTRVAASMIGIIIGAIVGGLAMMTRALDTQLLRKLKEIGQTPVAKFFSPFLTVILFGVLAGILLLALSGASSCMDTTWKTILGGAAGFFTLCTLAGLLPALGSLISYVALLEEAAQVPDVEI